jgi:DNA-binding NarL/FixJ family response regulator
VMGQAVACYGAADRFLGMLARTTGDLDAAERHFEAALLLNGSMGSPTWVAHTQYEYARTLRRRGFGPDLALAHELLAEAHATATSAGLVALAARTARAGAAVQPVIEALPDGMSAREVQVLRLVANGLSNREIGESLHISQHTAANHVRSILAKTGCANRTEAASYAHGRHLVGE